MPEGKILAMGSMIALGSKNPIRNRKEVKGSSMRQVTAAFIANLGTINTGLTMGFSAVAIPQLLDKNAALRLTQEQTSWVASLSSIGTPCGCILSAYLTDLLGRKRTLVLTEVPAIVGWILIAVAFSSEWIYVGRILTGFSSGMIGAPCRVYTAEVSQPHLRGILSALASVGVSLGVASEYFVGSMCTWRILAWISVIIPILSLCTSFLLPESPSWLVSSGQQHKCVDSLKKLRGSTCDVQREMNILVEFSARQNNNKKMSVKRQLRFISSPSVLKPFLILTTYFFIYQMSGSSPVTFYAVTIFENYGTTKDRYFLTVLMGILRLVFTVLSCTLMLRCRRRTLTFCSAIGCGSAMLILATYGVLIGRNSSVVWIPNITLLFFTVASTVGYLMVPWVMIGELYPSQVRGLVGGFTTALCYIFMFISVKTFPLLQNWLTLNGTLFLYGAVSLVGVIFLYFYLPETKDKSLQEIEEYFSGVKSKTQLPIPSTEKKLRVSENQTAKITV